MFAAAVFAGCAGNNDIQIRASVTQIFNPPPPASPLPLNQPLLSFSNLSHSFGTVALGGNSDHILTLVNGGTAIASNLSVNLLASVTGVSAPITIISNGCSTTLGIGESCPVTVRFQPGANNAFGGILAAAALNGGVAGARLEGVGGSGLGHWDRSDPVPVRRCCPVRVWGCVADDRV